MISEAYWLSSAAAGTPGFVPFADHRRRAAALAEAADDRAAARPGIALRILQHLDPAAPLLRRILAAAAKRRRDSVALLLRAAVADDDLLLGRARAGILAID